MSDLKKKILLSVLVFVTVIGMLLFRDLITPSKKKIKKINLHIENICWELTDNEGSSVRLFFINDSLVQISSNEGDKLVFGYERYGDTLEIYDSEEMMFFEIAISTISNDTLYYLNLENGDLEVMIKRDIIPCNW
jgi:hypothetical protein